MQLGGVLPRIEGDCEAAEFGLQVLPLCPLSFAIAQLLLVASLEGKLLVELSNLARNRLILLP